MSDSDSDSDYSVDLEEVRYRMGGRLLAFQGNDIIVALRPSEHVFEHWSCISMNTKREAGQRMKICAFWLPILLQHDEANITASWASQIGLIDPNCSGDLSVKQLCRIETLEAILRALEKGTMKKEQTKHVFTISNMFNLRSPEVLEDALHWLERAGEPSIRRRILQIGHTHVCFTALHLIFTEYAKFIQDMGNNVERTMKALMAQPCEYYVEKSEEMKRRGNENFQKQQYDDAVKFYSKAIKYYPDNHIIYGNRALCYIRCKKYLKAAGDGKRATLIKPLWAKGHYRYCEALFCLGEVKMAVESNSLAQSLCKDDHEGIRDLEQQHMKFVGAEHLKKINDKRADGAGESLPGKPVCFRAGTVISTSAHSKVSQAKVDKYTGKNERTVKTESSAKDSQPPKSEFSSKNGKGAGRESPAPKKKTKNRNSPSNKETQKVEASKASERSELRSVVQDAHAALADLRGRNAEQTFSQALALLDASTPTEFGLSTVDVLLLLYGRALSLTQIGQSEELVEAQKILEKIKSYEQRTFQCLVYYAVGKIHLRENRFAVALQKFSDSLQMVKNQITPGKLTWPLTKEIVKETQPDYFKEILESSIELCKFPPTPDAICRHEKCHGFLKAEIYFTDPDFKGFIQICCCQNCIIAYHITCWKSLKVSSFFEKNEKDFLQERCFTPNCVGQICSIKIFGPTGLMKCKFEAAIPKTERPKKPKVNQKCTSLKKIKSKEERRLKRKEHKQSFQEKQVMNDEILQQKEESAPQSQQKAWLLYRDRVLLQTSQNLELLREEQGLPGPTLAGRLRPWLDLDRSRGGAQLAGRLPQEPPQTLGQLVELLLESRKRVWARVLVEELSGCVDINPELYKWACQLNSAGLTSAKSFIERHAAQLEELDLAFLLNFGPLQEVIIDKLGARPEFFSSIGLTMTEYLKQAPPHDMRLFIWTLEEHRDRYLSCHSILDAYFDMDGHCSVIKKSDGSQNSSPMKSRGRKKKHKEPKGFFVFSEKRADTPGEWDQDFFEDDSLSFLHPGDPFSVPDHLREQVAHFECQYSRHSGHYKKILDNNPDPTKESLYDYFAQILEEHGPLVAEDPLLVGELVHFPSVAQLKIQECGGFEPFLLESLRFIKMGRRVGLARHAVSLQQAGNKPVPDEPDTICPSPGYPEIPDSAFSHFLDGFSSSHAEVCHPILPSPYAFSCPPLDVFPPWVNGDGQQLPGFLFPEEELHEVDLDLYSAEIQDGRPPSSGTPEDGFLRTHASVQTCQEMMRSVAVNTELLERLESCHGDLNKMQKSNEKLQQEIEKMENGSGQINEKHREDLTELEEELQKITTNIQVTNKELVLFQQKLEEEVKKDQKEKKANQEVLKSLKVEIEDLVEEQGSLSRDLRQRAADYEARFADFLELSNQSAAEKMILEDEISRCKASLTAANRRSHTAQLSLMESSRDQNSYGLYKELENSKALLSKLDEALHRYPTKELEMTRNIWRASVQEVEKKISTSEVQVDQVKNGRRGSTKNHPEPPAAPFLAAAEAPPTVFDKTMEQLSAIFPDYTRSDLMRFVQELRVSSGGSLSSMALQDMVGGVTQLILDHQEKPRGGGSPSPCATPTAWQSVGTQRPPQCTALNVDDPCIICHDDMSPGDICVLECRHSFHDDCIRSWLKEKSSCPTCRVHTLLPDDFPLLKRRPHL